MLPSCPAFKSLLGTLCLEGDCQLLGSGICHLVMALVLDYLRFTFSIGIRVNANLKRLRVLELKTILVREIASFNKC